MSNNGSVLLKRILRKKDFKKYFENIEASSQSPICLKDLKGKVLLGKYSENSPVVPIVFNEETVAWLCGEKEIILMAEILSLWITFEYEKMVLGEEVLEKYREVSFYYNLTEQLASNLEPLEVAQLLIKEAKKIIKVGDITIIINENYEEMLLATSQEDDYSQKLNKVCKGLIDSVLLKGQPELVNNFPEDPRYNEGATDVSSLMCAPLAIKDEMLGVVIVSSEKPVNYTAGDLKLLSTVAYQAAAAIKNADLVSKLKETITDLKNKQNELTNSIKMRTEFGHIFISVVSMVTLYTFLLFLLDNLNVDHSIIFLVSRVEEIIFVIINVLLVVRSGLPLEGFGLTLEGAKKSIVESLLISACFMVALAVIKLYLIKDTPYFEGASLISWEYVSWDYYTYILVAPLQEFICRGVLQGSIQRFLVGRYNWLWAIILTSFLFGIFHIHESVMLGIVAILGGFLWGGMYVRHKTLIGVSINHFLIGNWIGVLGFWEIITHG